MNRSTKTSLLLSVAMAMATTASVQSEDLIRLRSGGEIGGRVVGESELDGQKVLEIELTNGGKMTLLKTQVAKVLTTSAEELEYQERLKATPDTAEGHWALAQWCDEMRLRQQQEFHLLKVIKLDPNHEDARHDLGYSRIRGEWATRDQILRRDGRRSNGMLFEEFEIEKRKEEFEQRQTEFIRNLRVWRRGLGKQRHGEMLANIQAVEDPAAIKPIADLLSKEKEQEPKLLWLETLAQIPSPDTQDPLIQVALYDNDEAVRDRALQILKDIGDPSTQRYFMAYLDPNKNSPGMINRAGYALREVGDSEVVRALIETVVTQHKTKNPAAGNPGGIGAQFGNQGGGSFSFGGGGPKTRTQTSKNDGVRAALQEITGVDYQYDKDAWLNWFVSEKTPIGTFDLRRSD